MTERRYMTQRVTCQQVWRRRRDSSVWTVKQVYRRDRQVLLELSSDSLSRRRLVGFDELRTRFEGPLS